MTVTIGGRTVGGSGPCFVIAEAGSNHNGSFEQARRLIDVAAAAGADAVKFQLFRASRMYVRTAGRSDYLKLDRPIYDVIADMEMPYEWLPELAGHCRARGVTFLASVFDEESADRLDPYVDAFKIASYEMTHVSLVRYVAEKGKPLIVSTGTATLDEVAATVDVMRKREVPFVLMQCTAAYPAPLEALNIRAIVTMKREFGVPVGLSDHSRDPLVGPLAAVALGADALEKHFTLSNELPGPDHRFAVEPAELRLLVEKVRATEVALGSGEKLVQPVEEELRAFARRSIFAVRAIAADETLTRDNIAVLRNGESAAGLPPESYPGLLGRRAARPIAADAPIRAEDID
jgi:N-acetylneuraminate synthase